MLGKLNCPSQLPSLPRPGVAQEAGAKCLSMRPGRSKISSVLIKTRRETNVSPRWSQTRLVLRLVSRVGFLI